MMIVDVLVPTKHRDISKGNVHSTMIKVASKIQWFLLSAGGYCHKDNIIIYLSDVP